MGVVNLGHIFPQGLSAAAIIVTLLAAPSTKKGSRSQLIHMEHRHSIIEHFMCDKIYGVRIRSHTIRADI